MTIGVFYIHVHVYGYNKNMVGLYSVTGLLFDTNHAVK